jgi:putative flavoprotein involved in K+ transport
MTESVDVAIVGGGQAGLATSWYLKQAGVDHVVLEAGRVAETWRTRRWDSFCLVTPNWSIDLPGARYKGPDPDGFMPLAELIDYFQNWAESFHAPVQEQTPVLSLEKNAGDFVLSLTAEKLRARTVVVATGAFQRPYRPAGAEGLPTGLLQIFSEEYSNPNGLPAGAVLIVGSGQTGCQLAEELHDAGRKVFVACGRCSWAPRRMGGRDFVWWADKSGFLDRTPDMLPTPAARLLGNVQLTGHRGGHDLHYRVLHEMGVELLGRFVGADGGKIRFADDLADSVDFGDFLTMLLMKSIYAYCETNAVAAPEFQPRPPMRIKTRTELDVARDQIGTVIWTSGYRPDYSWVKLPVCDEMGLPIQTDGRSTVPGLYFMGVHWLRKGRSSGLFGVGEDAEVVARQIVAERK